MKQILILKEPLGKIIQAGDLFNKIKKIDMDYEQENFLVFYLDSGNKIINSEILFKGGLNSCTICLKTLFRKALIQNTNSMILAHNHTSGNLEPSEEDKNIFEMLQKAGNLLKIKILDNVIFNKKEYYSLKKINEGLT